jgi:hypothetical protein
MGENGGRLAGPARCRIAVPALMAAFLRIGLRAALTLHTTAANLGFRCAVTL